jgi:general secretion pathway protein I
MTNNQHGRGFTLMEVMIAMAILAITLVVVFQSQSLSLSLAGEERFLTTASLLAQGKMAELDSKDLKDISPSSGSFGVDYPAYAWQVQISDTFLSGLKKITVIVTTAGMGSNNTYELELYKIVKQ